MHGLRTSVATRSSRLRVLRPLFDKLHEWNERIPGTVENRPATVLIGSQRLPVDPWERAQIARWPCVVEEDEDSRRCRLVMEVLACMAKTMTDMERLDPLPQGQSNQQAELLLDGAMGMALQREVQVVIDDSVERGHLETAKRWGTSLYKLRRTVTWALQRIEESEHDRVRQLADSLTDLPADAGTRRAPTRPPQSIEVADQVRIETDEPPPREASGDLQPEDLENFDDLDAHEELRRSAESRHAGWSARTAILGLVFALSAVLCTALVWLPALLRDEPRSVSLGSLDDTAIVRAVAARPPSLYVDVDGAAWDAFPHVRKRRQVERVSDLVKGRGYDGVLFRDEGGRPLAHWIRGRGIALFDTTATESPRAVPVASENAGDFDL